MSEKKWFLEYEVEGAQIASVDIDTPRFVIGRHSDCDFQIHLEGTSRRHAELSLDNGELSIRDLNSSNGSFVNRQRIHATAQKLFDKDILHIANKEFRIVCKEQTSTLPDEDCTMLHSAHLETSIVSYAEDFADLLNQQKVYAELQPIVDAQTLELYAYEGLGRGMHDNLPGAPGVLFSMAEDLGKAVELSELMRHIAAESSIQAPVAKCLFLNAHPEELDTQRLLNNFSDLKQTNPNCTYVLEISEKAVTNLAFLSQLKQALADIGVQLAYDDFGAGQGRLLELMEVPPDYLKFDITLVRDIHQQPEQAQYVVKSLVEIAKNLDIVTLAEGIECQASADVCREIGFDLFQGNHFGRPTRPEA